MCDPARRAVTPLTGHPPPEDSTDAEPDYRFTLANERTYLAWIRTAVGLLAAGVALAQLVPEFGIPGVRAACGAVLLGLSALVAFGAAHRRRRVQAAIRRGRPLPPPRMAWALAAGLTLIAVVLLVVITIGDR